MALDFFAGCLGGCAGVIVGHPFDTVKVILQTQHGRSVKYGGAVDCIRSIIAKEGFRGLYKGMSSPLAGVAGLNAVVFGVYGNVQRRFNDTNSISSHFWGGCVAGAVQSFICSPIELVKSRMQVSENSKGVLHCLKQICRHEGTRGLFRGLTITAVRDVPAFGIYFASYEVMTRSKDGSPASVTTLLLAGGVAGTLSWLVFPIDVVKSRMQVDGMNGEVLFKNSYHCYKTSVAREGYRWLFKGFTLAILRAFPVNAVCFAVVSLTMRLPLYDMVGTIAYNPQKNIFVSSTESSLVYAIL